MNGRDLCRACLQPVKEQFQVWDDTMKMGFQHLAGIIIDAQDELPQTVCKECRSHFEEFLEFRRKVLASNGYLIGTLQDSKSGIERCETPLSPGTPGPQPIDVVLVDSVKCEQFFEMENGDTKVEEESNEESKKEPKPKRSKARVIVVDPNKIRLVKLSMEEQRKNHEQEGNNPAFLAMPFKCLKCYKGFNFERKLQAHLVTSHEANSKFQCPVCTRTLGKLSTYTGHLKRHECQYQCRACTSMFVEKLAAVTHYSSVHEGVAIQIPCRYCDKVFKRRSTLTAHVKRSHERPDDTKCDICNKVYISKDSLFDHMLIHTGEKNFPCAVCGQRFRVKSAVKSHMYKHSSSRPHYCALCDVQFKSQASLVQHRRQSRNHGNVQKFVCSECGRTFMTRSTLKAHSTFHDPGPREKCGQCDEVVPVVAMEYHRRKHYVRRVKKDNICHTCAQQFSTRSSLKIHMRTHTGEKPYSCDKCDSRFSQKSTLQTHNKLVHLKIKRKRIL